MAEYPAQFMWEGLHKTILGAWTAFFLLQSLGSAVDQIEDVLLCQQCGHEVTKAKDLIRIPSAQAYEQRNDTILGVNGVLIQLFQNPFGRRFEVITTKKADIFKHDKVFAEHSWWDGFSWRMALCPRCGHHLGWFFQPVNKNEGYQDTEHTFVGLILRHLLHQDYADSLLIIPKSYRS